MADHPDYKANEEAGLQNQEEIEDHASSSSFTGVKRLQRGHSITSHLLLGCVETKGSTLAERGNSSQHPEQRAKTMAG